MAETFTDPRVPANAYRMPTFMAVTEIAGPDGRVLNLNNIIFINAGSIVWFEQPNVFCVMHVPARVEHSVPDGIARYEGTWEAAAAAGSATPTQEDDDE